MARSQRKSKRRRQAAAEATLAQSLAPEEIRPGDYVAVLHEIFEFPSFYWCTEAALTSRDELVRLRTIPREDARPLKVLGACLPFVLVRQPGGRQLTLDVRRCRLARLTTNYAAAAWSAYRKGTKRNRD